MTITPGFNDLYPGSETDRNGEREKLVGPEISYLALKLAHAVEVGDLVQAAAADKAMRQPTTHPEDTSHFPSTVPTSWLK